MHLLNKVFIRLSPYRKGLQIYGTHIPKKWLLCNNYRCIKTTTKFKDQLYIFNSLYQPAVLHPFHRKYFSKGLINGDNPEVSKKDKEIKKITQLFPQPQATLNEINAKTPQKVFDIYYKQNILAPKSAKKKVQNNGWTCTYSFVWPEKAKFENTAISKRQAADKSAIEALHWLYACKAINEKGNPIYDKDTLAALKSKLNDQIHANISEASMERISRIWEYYKQNIRNIYDDTFSKAQLKTLQVPLVLTKDSTVDVEDELPEESGVSHEEEDVSEIKVHVHPVYGKSILPPSETVLQRRDRVLRRKFQEYENKLTPLPIDQYMEQITSTLEKCRVAVLVGAAGCGKSTRVPTGILRHFGATTAAIVSEPRRVAAIGLAERVADELGENVGETVGYQVRLHSKPPRPPTGSILYCTSGVLLRRLQLNPGLEGCTHVFIDEAHERDVNTDITLLLLKRALEINPQLKVIIMSATLDADVFTKYFDSCPLIEVPGRTYPVEIFYLDDIQKKYKVNLPNLMHNCTRSDDGKPHVNCREIAQAIRAVDANEGEGAILAFLPGWAEIQMTHQLLNEYYGKSNMHMILPIHSRLSTTDQTKIFSRPLPGIRKIVLATNIAETSITIPDVVYVIDSGAQKENRLKEGTGTACLETAWVSQSGAKQRAGRAGRVQLGQCYRLYTQEKELEFDKHTTPEVLRIPLEQTVLDCKTYAPNDKVEDFLSRLPEPPTLKAIKLAVTDLVDLGALSKDEQLTRLGVLLSTMSLHPRLGRSVLNAAIIGNVVSTANVATHCSTNVEVFFSAVDRREEIREIKRSFSETSDHSALHWIQNEFDQTLAETGWRGIDDWCNKYGLKKERLSFVRSLSNLHLEQLLKSGMMESSPDIEELNRFSDIDELTVAVLLSGANSLLVTKAKVKTKGKLKIAIEIFTSVGDKAHIGTESVNYSIKKQKKMNLLAYFGGYHSTERRALVVYKTSLITPHMALLFCKGNIYIESVDDVKAETILNMPRHKLKVVVPTSQVENIMNVKEMLWKTFDYYIERDVKNLDYEENTKVSRFKVRLAKAIGRILVEANREYDQGKHVNAMADEEYR